METENSPNRRRPAIASPGQIATTILLILAFVAWVVIVILGFQLQEQIDRNLRLIMKLAESAGI